MIDLDTVAQTRGGSRFDQLVALLIGIVAILAAILAVIQVSSSGAEARAQMMSARRISEVMTRLDANTEVSGFGLQSMQRAAVLGSSGAARGLVALEHGDEASRLVGEAELAAADRLITIAGRMGAMPTAAGPIDAYATEVITASDAEVSALADDQIAQVTLGRQASDRGSISVVGLSLVALAGVLAGLAAIVGPSRAGRATLVLGYIAAGVALGAGIVAVR